MDDPETDGSEDTSPLITDAIDEALEQLSEKPVVTASTEDDRTSRLNQIKELLSQKPDFATRSRPAFPLVRRASTSATSGAGKVLPRLMSLELFNPETDDLDSDSSGVSSPESVGSVISVISTKEDNKPRPTSLLDKHVSPVESTWSEECKRHLINLTDRLSSESLINDIDQFCRRTKLELDSTNPSSRYDISLLILVLKHKFILIMNFIANFLAEKRTPVNTATSVLQPIQAYLTIISPTASTERKPNSFIEAAPRTAVTTVVPPVSSL